MKKITNVMYRLLGSVAMYTAVMSITELNSFCILIIHQPKIPESLKQKFDLPDEK